MNQIGQLRVAPPSADRFAELPGAQLLVVGHYSGRGASSGAKIEMTSAALYRFDAGHDRVLSELRQRSRSPRSRRAC
jgi:hypothetical protein